MSAPDVTIVIPSHDARERITAAIERALAQQGVDLEVVVVDDASSDGTAGLAGEVAARDPRVSVLVQDGNHGVAAARERAVRHARGEFVWFVDDDDEWPPDAAAALVAEARRTGAAVVCAQARVRESDGSERGVGAIEAAETIPGAEAVRRMLRGEITGHLWNKLFDRQLLERIEFPRIRQHSDQAMVVQLLAAAPTVALLPRRVYTYVLRRGSILRSGVRRAESLRGLGATVALAVARTDATALCSTDYLYYRARYGQLARVKDATGGAYPPREGRRLVRETRREMSGAHLVAILRRRDGVRAAMYALAWSAPGLYARALTRAGGRR